MKEKLFGSESIEVANSYWLFGNLYIYLKNDKEAEINIRKALEIKEKLLGK